jgi:hypothetical protein
MNQFPGLSGKAVNIDSFVMAVIGMLNVRLKRINLLIVDC